MIPTSEVGSDGWYLNRCWRKLKARRKRIDALLARFENQAPLPQSLMQAPDAAKRFYRASRTGFAEMIVKAVKYPLRVQGVLTDADPDSADMGDAIAEKMLISSNMADEIDDVHRLSLVTGDGYAIISMHKDQPVYTAEDPREVVTIHDPVVQAERIVAAKFAWDGERGHAVAYLYKQTGVRRAIPTRREWRERGTVAFSPAAWEWEGEEEGYPDLVMGTVPVLRYRNEEGVGEFERHDGLLDRLEHMIVQGMTIATLQAFKQRAIHVSQEDMPDEDEAGDPIDYDDILSADPGALWKLPETSKVWESGNVDLTPVWTGMEKFTQQLSAVTFTPLAMFSPEGQNQSAAGAGFAREGRTFKIEDRQDRLGRVHAEALALLFALAKDKERARREAIQFIWRPAERYSLSEKGDAMTKYKAGGVPWRSRMIDVGQYTPRQVQRMEAERLADELLFPADVTANQPVEA